MLVNLYTGCKNLPICGWQWNDSQKISIATGGVVSTRTHVTQHLMMAGTLVFCRYVEIFFKRAEVAGVDYANMDARVTNLPSTLQPILQGLFRKEAVFTCGMSVAVWGGRDFFMFDLEDNANARQEVPHATNTVGGSTEHLHCLQGSSMSVTLRPAFVEAFASAVTTPGASHVNIYHHLGCGRLGWNLHVRALPPPEEEQRQQLADMGCLQLATPYPVSNSPPSASWFKWTCVYVLIFKTCSVDSFLLPDLWVLSS